MGEIMSGEIDGRNVIEKDLNEVANDFGVVCLLLCDSCLLEEFNPLWWEGFDRVVSLAIEMDEMFDRSGS